MNRRGRNGRWSLKFTRGQALAAAPGRRPRRIGRRHRRARLAPAHGLVRGRDSRPPQPPSRPPDARPSTVLRAPYAAPRSWRSGNRARRPAARMDELASRLQAPGLRSCRHCLSRPARSAREPHASGGKHCPEQAYDRQGWRGGGPAALRPIPGAPVVENSWPPAAKMSGVSSPAAARASAPR